MGKHSNRPKIKLASTGVKVPKIKKLYAKRPLKSRYRRTTG